MQIHGHRGARAEFPENTLPGFEYAIACGVDALELDLAVTRDNVLVVSHDPEMNPVFCDGPPGVTPGATAVIREMTLAQLREWDCGARANPAFPRQQAQLALSPTRVPTFGEVLDLAGRGGFDFNVETKIFAACPHLTPDPEEFVWLIYKAVAERGLLDRLILQSFDFRTLAAMRSIDARVRLSALFDAGSIEVFDRAEKVAADIISPHLSLANPDLVQRAHAAGMQVVSWTANTPGEWAKLAAAGVDGIITDDPAALIAYLRKR